MSYRSVKRVLGETSLERKCRFLFGACLLSLITGSFWWYSSTTDELVNQASRRTGRGLALVALHQTHFEAMKVQGYEAGEWIRKLGQQFEASLGLRETPAAEPAPAAADSSPWQFVRPQRGLPGAPADASEWAAVREFSRPLAAEADDQRLEFYERVMVDGQRGALYQYYRPVYVVKECTDCHKQTLSHHNDPALAALATRTLGELAAVVKVEIPDGERRSQINSNRAILLATAIITVFLAMVASYAIVRYVIVKPLKHLRDVADEISHGNVALRADIHTGDEFENLGAAFNRMVRHLTTAQEELTQANAALDQKVDELAQVNMRLYEMNRLKSDFMASMSHELRTPLNHILGFSDVLGALDSLDEKQKKYVRNIQSSGKVLLEMINDILDLAKIEAGKMELRLTDFAVEQVIHAQCELFRPQTERKNIDLEALIEPELPELFQDPARVQQILQNLLSNAIKFTPEGGRIVVSAQLGEKQDVVLSVADTGVGIAEEDQAIIFEKFRQGKSGFAGGDAITREHSGTGLGLSIVKELCKLLGGEISLASELGKGSTFTVRLPIVRSDHAAADPHVSPQHAADAVGSSTAL